MNPKFRYLLAALVVFLPAIQTILLIYFFFQATIFDFVPATDDEMFLWRQELTFNKVGFNGGYYTYDEKPAAWSLSRFGAHGPMFPIFYGTLGRIIGWQPYSGFVINLAMITGALALHIYLVKPDNKQLLIVGVLLMTFWPILYELPSNMQEAFHQGAAIFFATIFSLSLSQDEILPTWLKVTVIWFIVVISLFRPMWSVLLVPTGLLWSGRKSWRAVAVTLILSFCVIAAIFVAGMFLSAPYPNFVRSLTEELSISVNGGLLLFRRHAKYALLGFLGGSDTNFLWVTVRYQLLLLFVVFSVALIVSLLDRNNKRMAWSWLVNEKQEALFHVLNTGSILAMIILFYIPNGYQGFRVFAPYVLMTLLMLIPKRKYGAVVLVVAVNLLALPIFASQYDNEKMRNFAFDSESIATFNRSTQAYLNYEPNQSAWCNTILLDVNLLCNKNRCDYAMTIPDGMGISLLAFPDRLQAPLKSQFVLLDVNGYERLSSNLDDKLRLQLLTDMGYGTLHLNLDSACSLEQ